MGQNIDIGTISGMTAEQIINMMKEKGLGESGGSGIETIASIMGISQTLAPVSETIRGCVIDSTCTTGWFKSVDTDFIIQGTNGHASRLRSKRAISGGGSTYGATKIIVTIEGVEYFAQTASNNNYFLNHELYVAFPKVSTLGSISGHIVVYDCIATNGANKDGDVVSYSWPAVTLAADVYN